MVLLDELTYLGSLVCAWKHVALAFSNPNNL